MHELSMNKINEFSQVEISNISKDGNVNERLNKNKRFSFNILNSKYSGNHKDNSMNILKRSHVRNYDYLSLDESYFQDDLFNCCSKSRKDEGVIYYEKAHNYLAEFLDIQTLFNYYREFEMLKKILFDHDQKTLFEILSYLKSLHKIFIDYEKKQELFQNYNQTEVDEIFNIMKRICARNNDQDSKILQSFKFMFKN